MTTYTATTAAGESCKNHAMKGTLLCKANGGSALDIRHGVPLANSNAAKHGFYRPVFSDEEYADLLAHAENLDLAVARVRLRRINTYIDEHEESMRPDEYGRFPIVHLSGARTATLIVCKVEFLPGMICYYGGMSRVIGFAAVVSLLFLLFGCQQKPAGVVPAVSKVVTAPELGGESPVLTAVATGSPTAGTRPSASAPSSATSSRCCTKRPNITSPSSTRTPSSK